MKLSVIIATRNRAHAIRPCLDSVAAAFGRAAPLDAEIVIVDNGSTDDTAAVIRKWATLNASVRLQVLFEPRPNKARALNRALKTVQGELLAFTDDDCRLDPEYVNDLLRHDSASPDLALRGGRVELGDPTDLPITLITWPDGCRWLRALNSARYSSISGIVSGCNMTMHRAIVERLGPFDEDFGPGADISAGEDTEYIFRAYTANVLIEYVPDMTVFHHHGRKTVDVCHKLFRDYMTGGGAICMKYLLREPNLCRPFYWDLKRAIEEIIKGTNTFLPNIAFSHKHKAWFTVVGSMKYLFMCVRTQRLDKLFSRKKLRFERSRPQDNKLLARTDD